MPITKRPYDLTCDLCTSKLDELSEDEYAELMAKREAEGYRPMLELYFHLSDADEAEGTDGEVWEARLHVLCDNCREFINLKVLPKLKPISRPRRAQGQKRVKKDE